MGRCEWQESGAHGALNPAFARLAVLLAAIKPSASEDLSRGVGLRMQRSHWAWAARGLPDAVI